jgi:hypothetical protein
MAAHEQPIIRACVAVEDIHEAAKKAEHSGVWQP